jgi:hypothetical protein
MQKPCGAEFLLPHKEILAADAAGVCAALTPSAVRTGAVAH